jgi:hypothetical protein
VPRCLKRRIVPGQTINHRFDGLLLQLLRNQDQLIWETLQDRGFDISRNAPHIYAQKHTDGSVVYSQTLPRRTVLVPSVPTSYRRMGATPRRHPRGLP